MHIISNVNHSGGNSNRSNNEDTRIIGFRVTVSSIEESHESYKIISPDLIEELSVQYLKSKGYSVEKL